MPLTGTDQEKLQQLGKFKFADQATWMLNVMWPKEKDAHAEELWNFVAMFAEFENENHGDCCDLDEMGMHRVFEWLYKHQMMQEMRAPPQGRRRRSSGSA